MFATEPDWSYYEISSKETIAIKNYWTNTESLGGGDIVNNLSIDQLKNIETPLD